MDRLVEEMGGWLRVEIRHSPLAVHQGAFEVAEATRAAQWQGKFWEYHDLLLATPARDPKTLVDLAVRAGCNRDRFVSDLGRKELRDTILADLEAAAKADVEGTPAFLINGHTEVGWGSYEGIRQTVRRYRKGAATTAKPAPGAPGS
jgi:predicted DsbA family dithiol-disulfide isomerase